MQPTTVPPPAKVLVIDDNPIIQHTVQFALQEFGYQVFAVGDIADALNILRKEKPALILLDINFPLDSGVFSGSQRDGFWALEWLHYLEDAKGIPVIIISADPPEKSKAQALAAGAAAYFHKPINKDELAATIARLLGGKPSA